MLPLDGTTENLEIGVVIIGDEILSGKRQDRHATALRTRLAPRHLSLTWLQYLPDNQKVLRDFFCWLRQRPAVVFCFGGIGATPDDHSRAAAAAAFSQDFQLHPAAEAEILTQFGQAAYPVRIKMAWLPAKAHLIPNTFNRIPGFSLLEKSAHWHFFPGFPEMAWPMLDWVWATYYADWHREVQADGALRVVSSESALILLMEEAVVAWPELKLYSLPHLAAVPEVELGFCGAAAQVPAAIAWLKDRLQALGVRFRENEKR